MMLIDERGRLFGKLNIIDACVGLVVLGLIPLMYGAFLLFRLPHPQIATLAPDTVAAHAPIAVVVTGTDLRPYLHARVGASEVPFFLETPTRGELKVPALPPGGYDVALYDEAVELAVKPLALTVSTPRPPAPAPVVARRATIRALLIGIEGAMANLRHGDVDLQGIRLVSVTDARATTATIPISVGDRLWTAVESAVSVSAVLEVPVVASDTGWNFMAHPIKTGAPIRYETVGVLLGGTIVDVVSIEDIP